MGVGSAVHFAGAHFYVDYVETFSLLPCLAGLSLCLGGKPALKWSWPSIAFLLFMLPLPYRMEMMLGHPLRRIAVVASTYVLQTLGFAAVAEGNVILLEKGPILVSEACNGLSMLLTFFALSTALAMVIKRCVLDKVILVLSALPIALIANLVRITVTAVLAETVSVDLAQRVFHDLAGWLMMPLALGLLWAELALLSKLLIEHAEEDRPSAVFGGLYPARPSVALSPAASIHGGTLKQKFD